ncbi:MAG: aspartate aminotransferase family protein [Candidatus Wallbacteria bacterium]|nr:aspartate aminotransferase family protein [Candidatus Wallbacteria bacterium]
MTRDADILRAGFEEFGRFINPMIAQRATLTGEPFRMVRAHGGVLHDAEGKAYEDFHGTQAFGHRHPAIALAVRQFLESDIPSWYPSRLSPHAGRFARLLCERSGYDNAFFTCTGSDAVEAAMKLARAATRRPRILGLERAYHGCGYGATALMPPGPFRDPFGPHLPGVETLAFGDVAALEQAFEAGGVCVLIVEPIQGEGGVRAVSDDYVQAACALTARHDALLVADEVQTGFGRSGHFLLSAGWPRKPDAAILAKALGGGLVPLSAMLTRREIFERAYGSDVEDGEAHNATFSYNAVAAVAGLAALELLTEELMARVSELGEWFRERLSSALEGLPLFREVRGRGLILGIELASPDHPWLGFEHFGLPSLAEKGRSPIAPLLCHRLYRRGFYCFPCGHDWNVVRLQPRYFIERETLERFTIACREELEFLCGLT